MYAKHYQKYGRIYGMFFGTRPTLMVSEPLLIRDILVKDFHLFIDRNDLVTGDPFSDHSLFNNFGDEWKQLRSVISPTFSSGKMRKMRPLIEDCVTNLEKVLSNAANTNKEIELKKLMGNLTMDVIATCAFAIKIDSHNDSKNQFVKNAEKLLNGGLKILLSYILLLTFPNLTKRMNLSFIDKNACKFFKTVIESIKAKRKNNNSYVDFMQLMINSQKLENCEDVDDITPDHHQNFNELGEHNNEFNKTRTKFVPTDTDILANAFLFFVAGYETTSSLLSFLCYLLALNEHCQQKLYEEIISAPNLDYDTVSKLPYLDACIAETLRLYTPLGSTHRIAAKQYKLGETGITIPKGMIIQINIEGIHHDPKYYPNPEQFDPERFMPENRHKLVPYTYLPFGFGPRNCVGMRFALMEAKTAITRIVTQFKFVRTANTEIPVEFRKFVFLISPKNDIKVGVQRRTF